MNKEDLNLLSEARRRGAIMETLKVTFPDGVDFIVLWRSLVTQGHSLTEKELRADVVYLGNDGYLEYKKSGEDILFVTATNKGIRLAKGVLKDDMVLVRK